MQGAVKFDKPCGAVVIIEKQGVTTVWLYDFPNFLNAPEEISAMSSKLCPSSSCRFLVFSLSPLFSLFFHLLLPSHPLFLFPPLTLYPLLLSISILREEKKYKLFLRAKWLIIHETKLINSGTVIIHQESEIFCFPWPENSLLNFLIHQQNKKNLSWATLCFFILLMFLDFIFKKSYIILVYEYLH